MTHDQLRAYFRPYFEMPHRRTPLFRRALLRLVGQGRFDDLGRRSETLRIAEEVAAEFPVLELTDCR